MSATWNEKGSATPVANDELLFIDVSDPQKNQFRTTIANLPIAGGTVSSDTTMGDIKAIFVDVAGSLYVHDETLTITATGTSSGTGATGTAISGNVLTVTIDNAGTGYVAGEEVSLDGLTSSNAIADVILVGEIATGTTSVGIIGGGSGFIVGQSVTIIGDSSNANNATGTVTVVSGTALSEVNITDGGTGYSTGTETIIGKISGANDATADIVAVGGVIQSLTINAPGTGYTDGEIVDIDGGTGATAIANATVGVIDSLTFATGGTDYIQGESLTITSIGGGTGATATVDTLTGKIAGLSIFTSGSDYSAGETFVITEIDTEGSGTGATGTVDTIGNTLLGVELTGGGDDFVTLDTVSLQGTGFGTGATGIVSANVVENSVVRFDDTLGDTITNGIVTLDDVGTFNHVHSILFDANNVSPAPDQNYIAVVNDEFEVNTPEGGKFEIEIGEETHLEISSVGINIEGRRILDAQALILRNTNDAEFPGRPFIQMELFDTAPATNAELGVFSFRGQTDTLSTVRNYAVIRSNIRDNSDTLWSGDLRFQATHDSVLTLYMSMNEANTDTIRVNRPFVFSNSSVEPTGGTLSIRNLTADMILNVGTNGSFKYTFQNNEGYTFDNTDATFNGKNLTNVGIIQLGGEADTNIQKINSDLRLEVGSSDSVIFRTGSNQYEFSINNADFMSNNILMGQAFIEFQQISTPTPAADHAQIYAKTFTNPDASTTLHPFWVEADGTDTDLIQVPIADTVFYVRSQADIEAVIGSSLTVPDDTSVVFQALNSFTVNKGFKLGVDSLLKIFSINTSSIILTNPAEPLFSNSITPSFENIAGRINLTEITLVDATTVAKLFDFDRTGAVAGSLTVVIDRCPIVNWGDLGSIKDGIVVIDDTQLLNFNIGLKVTDPDNLVCRGLGFAPKVGTTNLTNIAIISKNTTFTDVLIEGSQFIGTGGLQSGVFADPTFDTTSSFRIRDNSFVGAVPVLFKAASSVAVTAAALGTTGGAGFTEFTAISHGLIVGQATVNSTFSDSNYNGTFVVTAVADADTYEVETLFTLTGTGSTNANSLQTKDPQIAASDNQFQRDSMIIGGFNSTGTFPTVALTSISFIDMDFTIAPNVPVSLLVNQERFQLIDADIGEFEFIGEQPEVVRLEGTHNATGGSAGNQSAIYEWRLVHQPLSGIYGVIPDSQPVTFGLTENTDAANATFVGVLLLSKGDRIKPEERRVSGTRASFQRNPFVVDATT